MSRPTPNKALQLTWHSALGYRPPLPEAIEITPPGMVSLPLAAVQALTLGADYNGGRVNVAFAYAVILTSSELE